MELPEAIKARRSIRVFADKEVEKEKIQEIINLATFAPSNCNIQGWRFIIIDQDEIKGKIVNAGGAIIIKNAPVGILVVYDNQSKNYEYKDYIQSASAAIQNIHLAAKNYGLGSCWICHLPSHRVLRKLLNIPNCFTPIAYVILGYPKSEPVNVPRKYSLDQVMSYNTFSPHLAINKVSRLKIVIQKILVRIYYLTPLFIKKAFLNKLIDSNFVKKFKN